jgi:hypothetical protein
MCIEFSALATHSLAQSQYESLLNRLGIDRIKNKTSVPLGLNANLACRSRNVELLGMREAGGQAFPHSERDRYFLSNTTREFINRNPDRLLAVMNIGAHYHNMLSHYKEDLDLLIQWFEEYNRPNDLYFFRTTVPGHGHCQTLNPRKFNWTKGVQEVPLKT